MRDMAARPGNIQKDNGVSTLQIQPERVNIMADCCNYNVRARADDKRALLLFYASFNDYGYKKVKSFGQKEDGKWYIYFAGCCKWGLDMYKDDYCGGNIDLSEIPEDANTNEWYSWGGKWLAYTAESLIEALGLDAQVATDVEGEDGFLSVYEHGSCEREDFIEDATYYSDWDW